MDSKRTIPEQTMVVLLAAGKGTRMGRADLVKVCFEIDSIPAINRQIAVFKRQRFSRFLVVVGRGATRCSTRSARSIPGVLYVHQEPQLGTGHAAKIAAEALQSIGYQDYVLVTMGDKYLEENALAALVDGYVKQRADMALLTIPKTATTEASAGRVIVDEHGQALDIIEQIDLARQLIADDLRALLGQGGTRQRRDVLAVIERHIPRAEKQAVAVADLLALAEVRGRRTGETGKNPRSGKYNLEIAGKRYAGKQIERLSAARESQLVPDARRGLLPGRGHDPQRQCPRRILHDRHRAAAVRRPRLARASPAIAYAPCRSTIPSGCKASIRPTSCWRFRTTCGRRSPPGGRRPRWSTGRN